MELDELMLGNYVYDNVSDEICLILSIREEHNKVDVKGVSGIYSALSISCISAIPLTVEWLDKLNYCVDEQDDSLYEDNNLCFSISDEGDYTGNRFSLEDRTFYIDERKLQLICGIVYVHQFQNWHYLLTGEKLKIK